MEVYIIGFIVTLILQWCIWHEVEWDFLHPAEWLFVGVVVLFWCAIWPVTWLIALYGALTDRRRWLA